ncbi:MAG: prolipoprotein diacylglyceryl transferase [Candidatus Falkowbacteria bacterium]|nr:prolipoprotein diacylglyceryl transferase [Candidatus Falkowbacteria bacterium]
MFIVLGILATLVVALKLAEFYSISKETMIDLAFYLIIAGVLGARLYDILLAFPYYAANPLETIKIWNGGLAIHGALLAGIITLWLYAKKKKINFWLLSALVVPGLALAQAIGRWGNYFNQELYGRPTNLPWGIPIEPARRLPEFFSDQYFHPTFLYESLGSLVIFCLLLYLHYLLIKKQKFSCQRLVLTYLCLYSLLRFAVETLRVDYTYFFLGLRWPQFVSLLVIIFSCGWLIYQNNKMPGLEKK